MADPREANQGRTHYGNVDQASFNDVYRREADDAVLKDLGAAREGQDPEGIIVFEELARQRKRSSIPQG